MWSHQSANYAMLVKRFLIMNLKLLKFFKDYKNMLIAINQWKIFEITWLIKLIRKFKYLLQTLRIHGMIRSVESLLPGSPGSASNFRHCYLNSYFFSFNKILFFYFKNTRTRCFLKYLSKVTKNHKKEVDVKRSLVDMVAE